MFGDGEHHDVTVTCYNQLKRSEVKIIKRDEETGEVIPLEGAQFQVYKAENGAIVGEPHTLDGAAIFTTDSSGSASSKELYLGCYKLVETKAPTGYILDSSEILVDLTYAGQEVEVTSSGATASNQYQNVNITVPKTMESATEYGIDASDYVRYVTFGLYANEDITAADGSAIPQDGLIQTVELSDNMTANFNAKLPFGSYYVKELTTDEHYILSDEKHEFEFSYQGEDIETVEIDAGEFTNELKRGSVKGIKVDADDNSPLANCKGEYNASQMCNMRI